MNTADAAALFHVGFAFLRRFSRVTVRWSKNTILRVLEERAGNLGDGYNVARDLVENVLSLPHGADAIQPGVLKSFIGVAEAYLPVYASPVEAVEAAFRDVVLPQLRSLPFSELEDLQKKLRSKHTGLAEALREYVEALG